MGIFSAIKQAMSDNEVVFEGATEEDREEFNKIVGQIAMIYKGKKEREALLMLQFQENVKSDLSSEGNTVYRIYGNRSFSRDALFNAFKKAAIDSVRSYTPK